MRDGFTVGISFGIFLYDNVVPNMTISYQSHNGRYRSSQVGGAGNPLSGTATDPNGSLGSGMSKVEVRLGYLISNDTYYWTGALFASGSAVSGSGWRNTGNVTWEFTYNITWRASDTEYTLEARGEDQTVLGDGSGGGNVSVPGSLGTDIRKFVVDDTIPSLGIEVPTMTWVNSLGQITGTANTNLAGTDGVEVELTTGTGGGQRWWRSSDN